MKSRIFRLDELINFNPTRLIKKGTNAPFVEMAAIPEGSREVQYFDLKEYDGAGSRFTNGDTLFARITPCLENGKTAKVEFLPEGINGHGSTEFIVMSAKDLEHDEDLVYYLCRLPAFRDYAKSRMQGTSGRQRVEWRALAEFEIELPNNPTDRFEIGFRLKTLDDKIKVNKQINKVIESISQALFKSWFVDFDPVRAKIAAIENGDNPQLAVMQIISGKSVEELPELPVEQQKKLAEIANLFPNEFEQTEVGEIPKGWKVTTVESLAEHNKSAVSPLGSPDEQFYHYSIPAFDNGCFPSIEAGDIIKSNKYRISSDSILVSKLNPSTPRIWDVINPKPNSVCSTEFQCFVPKENYLYEFLSLFLKSEATTERLSSLVTGTSKSHQRVRPADMLSLKVISPSEDLLKRFSELTKPQYQLKNHLTYEQHNLAEVRDSLLPKLLSGSLKMVE